MEYPLLFLESPFYMVVFMCKAVVYSMILLFCSISLLSYGFFSLGGFFVCKNSGMILVNDPKRCMFEEDYNDVVYGIERIRQQNREFNSPKYMLDCLNKNCSELR